MAETTAFPWLDRLRLVAAVGGMVMVVVALAADRLGLDHDPSFGTGETLLFGTGAVVLVAAVLGRRLPAAWSGLALMLFNTAILLLVVELGLIALRTVGGLRYDDDRGVLDQLTDHYLDLPYYQGRPWAADYWRENSAARLRTDYHPFVGWRRPPHEGEWVNVDAEGLRPVPGARCDAPDAYRLWAFGGSTMWGWGAPDGETIPAYLQRLLAEPVRQATGRPLCVVSFGETAWVANQGLIALSLRLTGGETPDRVVFYDGVNEVLSAHQSGLPDVHQNLRQIEAKLETPATPLLEWLRRRETVRALGLLTAPQPTLAADYDPSALGPAVAANYLGVHDVVSALGQGAGFAVDFFWQPHLVVGDKPLTPEEAAMVDQPFWALEITPELRRLFGSIYAGVVAEAEQRPNLHDLSDLFDTVEDGLWIDTWGHVTPEGNRRVAEAMVEVLLEGIAGVGEEEAVGDPSTDKEQPSDPEQQSDYGYSGGEWPTDSVSTRVGRDQSSVSKSSSSELADSSRPSQRSRVSMSARSIRSMVQLGSSPKR